MDSNLSADAVPQVAELDPAIIIDQPGFPAFPAEQPAGSQADKSASYVNYINPTAPLLAHRTYNCAIHPSGLVLEGLYTMPVTHMPKPPYFAYAFYEAPLGASAADLETLKLTAEVSAAGEEYYIAMANYSAMHWEWYGPAGATAEYIFDMPTLGYDFTSPWGSMYFVVVVPQANRLHLEEIKLEFKDGEDPTWWNVWGRAYSNYSAGSVLGGHIVEFEDMITSTVYTTTTAADGNWGTNLPSGTYKFRVLGNEMLFDPAAYVMIEELEVTLEVVAGNIIYIGSNAAYSSTVIPMPLITVNSY